MSLQIQPVASVPEQTKQVAQAAFPKGNLYLRVPQVRVEHAFASHLHLTGVRNGGQ